MRFFFYGTLRDPEIRKRVLGPTADRLSVEAATLSGWRCVHMLGRSYPVIVPAGGGIVAGCVTQAIDRHAAKRLDLYEGSEYRSRAISVTCAGGAVVGAHAYTLGPTGRASGRQWDFEDWLVGSRRDG